MSSAAHPPAPSPIDQEQPRLTPAVQALIAINIAFAFVQATVWRADDMIAALGFQWGDISGRWWTAVTYMFVHANLWHLAANMYALFAFGPRLEHELGARRFLRFYALAAAGGLVFHALFARTGVLIGASAAVFGVMGAYALQWPKDELYLFGIVPLRVWTVVLLFSAFNLAMGLYAAGPASGVAYLAHLGGFAVAWFYMRTPQGVSIDQLRQRVSQVSDSDDSPPRAIPRALPRSRERLDEVDEIVAKSKALAAKHPTALTPVPAPAEVKPDEVNRVLDKISAQGLESLTDDERRLLEEMSKRLRKN